MNSIKKNIQVSTTIKTLVLSLLVLIFIGCDDDDASQFGIEESTFNIDLFEQNLIDNINAGNNNPIGWAYTISKDGTLVKSNDFGQARTSVDGAIDFSIDKEINVASVTKFYTAIAVMQLLDANNLTIEDPIAPWLPASWETDNGVDGLSFKDLLKHESGLQSTNDNFDDTLGYEGLRNCINTGVVNSKSRNYLNVNFALFRVLIPSLWDASDDTNAINIELDGNTQFMYLLYMQENIFDRLQLPVVDCWPESPDLATLYYNVNDINNQTNGTYYNDWNNKSGGGGYFMSATEMAVVNAYFEHTEILVNASQRTIMKEHRLGMDLEDNAGREMHGNYYAKGGSIGNSSNIAISQGVLTQIAMFPINGIDCVVVMNCQGMTFPGNSNLRQLIYTAFNNAWE